MHGVNRTTLMNHLKGYHCSSVGRPTILTHTEEGVIVHALKKLGEWGFDTDRYAVRCIVMNYLSNVGHQHVFPKGSLALIRCMHLRSDGKES